MMTMEQLRSEGKEKSRVPIARTEMRLILTLCIRSLSRNIMMVLKLKSSRNRSRNTWQEDLKIRGLKK